MCVQGEFNTVTNFRAYRHYHAKCSRCKKTKIFCQLIELPDLSGETYYRLLCVSCNMHEENNFDMFMINTIPNK